MTISVIADSSGIITEGLKYVMNPFDEFAVEEAVRIKEKLGEGTNTLISIGPKRAVEAIRMGPGYGEG